MEAKKEFQFYIDRKCTIWHRTTFNVYADTEHEAEEIAIKLSENSDFLEENGAEYETLYDTMEFILPEENDNNSTEELYSTNKLIKHNGNN